MTRPVGTTEPHTSNLYVEPIRNEAIDKIDLLFMIDNSASMGDKQKLLAAAVPQLVDRLVVPRCVDAAGAVQHRTALSEPCPAGMAPEFQAVKDIHIAVITSSLGVHGAKPPVDRNGMPLPPVCASGPRGDDHARLLPSMRPELTLASYAGQGFLAWDPDKELVPPGQADAATLGKDFGAMVQAAGEDGCGYEASLESWYRFLIDPEPPLQISVGDKDLSVPSGVDSELLAQRQAFLRPDSLVAIVMLTDENDCSIMDESYGNYLANSQKPLPHGTSACAKDPNDQCCLPCTTLAVPAGCTPLADDPACKPAEVPLQTREDHTNLRCMENKRRFGIDFLYPTSRYVGALTQPQVRRRSDGEMVENPLFAAAPGKPRRTKELIYLAGIVGVPWQDIADEASQTGAGLRYLTAAELSAKSRWDVIVGDSSKNQKPSDPFMQESEAPRSGTNPVIGVAITPETSTDPRANPINGHEYALGDGGDLQYACTFQLTEPDPCDDPDGLCDCADPLTRDSTDPLCQPPGGGAASTKQYFGKAYPGLRPLEVLKGIGDSAIVASICPKVLTEGQPGYGYEPAVDAIVDRLKIALNGRCPPRPLAVEAGGDGQLPCVVVEALEGDDACGCMAKGRSPASEDARAMIVQQLREQKTCDVAGFPKCDSYCFCEIAQARGETLRSCLNDVTATTEPGYCYVDPFGTPAVGNAELVKDCGASKRLIRFVGDNTPTPGATAYIACLGATVH
jgi:hypothetical protein